MRRRDEEVGVELLDGRLGRELVLVVGVAPEEADRQRVDVELLDEPFGLGLDLVEVHWDEHRARPVDALVDLADRAAVEEVGDVDLEVVVDLRRADAAGDAEGVLEAVRAQHADLRAAQCRDRVRHDGRAIDEELRAAEQLGQREAELLRRHLDGLEHAATEVVVRRQGLAALDAVAERDRHIGVRTADVDADERVAAASVVPVVLFSHRSPPTGYRISGVSTSQARSGQLAADVRLGTVRTRTSQRSPLGATVGTPVARIDASSSSRIRTDSALEPGTWNRPESSTSEKRVNRSSALIPGAITPGCLRPEDPGVAAEAGGIGLAVGRTGPRARGRGAGGRRARARDRDPRRRRPGAPEDPPARGTPGRSPSASRRPGQAC